MDIVNRISSLPVEFMHTFWYVITFLLVFVEWIPPLWVFSPGQFIMLFGWFLARIDVLNIYLFIAIWFVASFFWDFVGYIIWKKLWLPFLKKYWKYLLIKENLLESTKNMLNKHLFKAILFSRFYGWTRVITPFISWVSHVSINKYLIYSFVSCLAWAIFWWIIWYIFGSSYELVSKYMWKFMFFAIIFGIITIFAYRYVNKKKHIFNREYLYTFVVNLLSVFILAKLADELAWNQAVIHIDNLINFKINSLSNPLLDQIMIWINNIWNIYIFILLSLFFIVYLIYKKKKYHYWLFILWAFGWFLIDIFMKIFIGRLRPENALIFLKDYSFPSWHTTMITILFLSVWVIFEDDIKSRWKQFWFFLICFIPIIIIWFSRIYLNVHWFSDVVAWFFLWVFWITFMILVLKFIISNKMDKDMVPIP